MTPDKTGYSAVVSTSKPDLMSIYQKLSMSYSSFIQGSIKLILNFAHKSITPPGAAFKSLPACPGPTSAFFCELAIRSVPLSSVLLPSGP